MTNFIYLLGPAGCGKSTLAAAIADTFESQEIRCPVLNLDPGVEWLPYTPELDIRTYISLREVMKEYRLGPNGALVVSVDLIVNHLRRVREIITEWNPDYVIVDTPGQMELFAFRETGPAVIKGLNPEGNSLVLFLIDSAFTKQASSFASMLMLATSVFTRFMLPQLNLLTKTDAVEPETVERTVNWTTRHDLLLDAIDLESHELRRESSRGMLEAVSNLGFVGELQPVSALQHEGIVELQTAIERALGMETKLDLEKEEEE